jgi:hypothetical protein
VGLLRGYHEIRAQQSDRANDEERDQLTVPIERHGRAPRHGSSRAFGHMTRIPIILLDKLLTRMLLVSLLCSLCFVIERFVYNFTGIGRGAHRSLTIFLWLLLLPWIGYWIILVRSQLCSGWRQGLRVAAFGAAAFMLAVGFLYSSAMVLWNVAASRGVQFW